MPITPPPLRDRKEDIPVLAEFFLRKFSRATRRNVTEISPQARIQMAAYGWPGNVRELANAIERAVVLGAGSKIEPSDLPAHIASESVGAAAENVTYRESVNSARREILLKALGKTQDNRAAAARLLGLETKYFLRLMKSLGID